MGLGLTRDIGTSPIPIWQGVGEGDIQLVQGGFLLDITGLALGSVIPGGTPVVYDEAARTAVAITTAKLYADATNVATTYQVYKGHTYKVGDYFAAVVGGKAYAITAIDTTTSTLYDIITVGTTLGAALTAGSLTFRSTLTGAASATMQDMNGLLYVDTVVAAGTSVSVVIRGTVYARRVPYNTTIEITMDQIIYSQSK